MIAEGAQDWRNVDPKGKVRVTLRMQWDTTIASFEVFMPLEFVTECDADELFRHYAPELWGHTIAELKDRSVARMMVENGVG